MKHKIKYFAILTVILSAIVGNLTMVSHASRVESKIYYYVNVAYAKLITDGYPERNDDGVIIDMHINDAYLQTNLTINYKVRISDPSVRAIGMNFKGIASNLQSVSDTILNYHDK